MLTSNLHSKQISLLGFFYFQLLICPPDAIKIFTGFFPWITIRVPPSTHCGAYITFVPLPLSAFYNNICSKMDISKSAWINACISKSLF